MAHDQYIDLLTFALVYAAEANYRLDDQERTLLAQKAGHANLDEIQQLYNRLAPDDRDAYIKEMSEKWLMTDGSKNDLLGKIREMMFADHEIDADEKKTYERLKGLIYG